MKQAYLTVLMPDTTGYTVYIPDFDVNTQGETIAEAISMARDAIGLMGITMQDDGQTIPEARVIQYDKKDNELLAFVDIDFDEYRRENDMRTVRRNVSLPSYLNSAAEKEGLNVSQVLQKALKEQLNITDR